MTAPTNNPAGAAMTDEQITAFEGLPIEQAKFYFDRRNADGRSHREMVAALLSASKPAGVTGPLPAASAGDQEVRS